MEFTLRPATADDFEFAFEVKRDALKRMGIDWRSINNITLFGTNMIAGAAVRTISTVGSQ